jgi:hypothetical protein
LVVGAAVEKQGKIKPLNKPKVAPEMSRMMVLREKVSPFVTVSSPAVGFVFSFIVIPIRLCFSLVNIGLS